MVLAAVIAALYIVLTITVAPFAYGPVQFRLSEILTILPALTPAAIPGLAIGCLLSNILNPAGSLGLVDMIGGTAATLIGAILTRWIAKRTGLIETSPHPLGRNEVVRRPALYLMTLPPILSNALIVGSYLTFLLFEASEQTFSLLLFNMFSVGLGEVVMAGIGGVLVYLAVAPRMQQIYRRNIRTIKA